MIKITKEKNIETTKKASVQYEIYWHAMVHEMAIGIRSSKLIDVINLCSIVALPPKTSLSVPTIVGATTILSTRITTGAAEFEDHNQRSHMLIRIYLVPRAPRYVSAPCFIFIDH